MTPFPTLPDDVRVRRLTIPDRVNTVILDTDVANEIDDPFAIAHAVLSPERIELAGITIAPFRREGVAVPESLRMSRELCDQTLAALGRKDISVHQGSARFMESPDDAVPSEAVDALIQAADTLDHLFVLSIGAATNVASALIRRPDLVEKITVLWLGGHAPDYVDTSEYNLAGDLLASRILLSSGVPLIRFPAIGVTSHLLVSLAALERDIDGDGGIGSLLTDLVRDDRSNHYAWEKEMWDVAVTAAMVKPEWTPSVLESTPDVSDDLHWISRPLAPLHRRVVWVNRNAILGDLFEKVHSARQ